MLRYVYGQDEIVADFVAQMIPSCRERGFGNCKAIGVIDDDGRLIAGLVYHNYEPGAAIIEISGAALPKTKWFTRETMWRMYEYPFDQCGCQMVVKRVPAENEQLLGYLAALDHMLIKVPRLFGREQDGVLCLLTYEDWANGRLHKWGRRRFAREEIKEAA